MGIVRLDAVWHPARHQTESRGVVVRSYKGTLSAGMPISFHDGGVCYDALGLVGAVHVVYARRLHDGRYSTNCTRSHVLGESKRDTEFLDRFATRLWLAVLVEPLGCNEARLLPWLRRVWYWSLTV